MTYQVYLTGIKHPPQQAFYIHKDSRKKNLNRDIQKTKMEHQLFEKPTLSHQAVHEDLEMFLLLTCTNEPEKSGEVYNISQDQQNMEIFPPT